MRSRKKSPPAVRSKRGLQVVSGRGGSGRAPEESGHALALKGSRDPSAEHPNRLPLLPLRSDVVFPQTVVPLVINRPSGIRLIDDVMIGERMVGLVSQLHPETDEPGMTTSTRRLRRDRAQDAQVSRRLDADRLPGAIPGRGWSRWFRPSPT